MFKESISPTIGPRSRLSHLVAFLLLLCGSLTSLAWQQPPSHLIHLTLQLKWLPQAQFAGYFVAQDRGFYRQQGLSVSFGSGGPTIAPENAVLRGQADVGVDWLSALLVARDRGADLTNIAQIFQASGQRLIAFKSSGIRTVPQLRGKRVGVSFAGNQYQFNALMGRYHMAPPQKYMTVVSQDVTMRLFLTHQIDATTVQTYNELGIVYEHGVKPNRLTIFDYNALGVSMLEDDLFARPAWLHTHASVVVRFLRASLRGWQWAVAHPSQAGMISYRYELPGYSTPAHQTFMARQVALLVMHGLYNRHAIGYMDPRLYAQTWRTLLREHVIRHVPHNAYDQHYWAAAGGYL
jgi:NitT/TauT family transport system substrate-binding protein